MGIKALRPISYHEKLIISGDIIEYFEYERQVRGGIGVRDGPLGRSKGANETSKEINRVVVMQRARTTLRRLINANIGQWVDSRGRPYVSKFVTLTFADNVTELAQANPEFKKFIKRLNRYVGYKVEYNAVPEFQKRGAVHYHVIFYNLSYIANKKLREIWNQGFVRVNNIDKVDNVGAYVCKYMGKDFGEVDKLKEQKCYFSSRGLLKPVEIKEKPRVQSIVGTLSEEFVRYKTQFDTEYLGKIQYTQYNLKSVRNQEKVCR